MWCVLLTTATRLAWVEQHQPRREADGAAPEEPEEQGVDLLQIVSEPQLRWCNAYLNVQHFENSERWLP